VDETELALMIAAGSQPVSAQSQEPPVAIPPMPDGGEVVSDYRSVGLTLRQHPVSFVGEELTRLGAIPFARLSDVRPGRRIWPKMFERQRRILLSASMIARRGLLQRESDVTHVVAEQLTDLSGLLASIGHRALPFPIAHGRGDQVTHGGGPDPRESFGRKPREIHVANIHIDALKVKTRDFR
jgi:error-prone DNA polymerase